MPIATLTFNLPEEKPEHELALAAGDLASSLAEVARVLRDHEKHGKPTSATRALVEKLRGAVDFEALDRAGF